MAALGGADDAEVRLVAQVDARVEFRLPMLLPPDLICVNTDIRGVRLTQLTLTEMEKRVIARVNGDCIGFSQSIMFGCDLIAAREDAIVADVHMDLQKIFGFDTVPGDGGGALVPLHMYPAKAMEYPLLAKP